MIDTRTLFTVGKTISATRIAAITAEMMAGDSLMAQAAWMSSGFPSSAAEKAAMTAIQAAKIVGGAVWDDYFTVLDHVLAAGKQGDPWSADVVERQAARYRDAGGLCEVANH